MERQDIKLLKPPKEETVPPPPLTGQDLIEERVFEVRQHIVRALSTS
jgi:hypothetical protein